MLALPETMLADFSQQLTALCAKYADTYQDIHARRRHSAAALSQMMDDLAGNDFDMQGIKAWQTLLAQGSKG